MMDRDDIEVVPSGDPVTLVEAKAWLRMRTTADDALITALITAATLFGEKFCNRVFVEREYFGFFDGLRRSNQEFYQFVMIRRAPLASIESVAVYSGGSYSAFTDYVLKETNGFSRLIFENCLVDGDPDANAVYPLKVGFKAGYGNVAAVPEDIKTAIKEHVSFLYENRGDAVAEGKLSMPLEVRSIYSGKYRILNTFG